MIEKLHLWWNQLRGRFPQKIRIRNDHGAPYLIVNDRWQRATALADADEGWMEIDPSCGLCIGMGNNGGGCWRRRHPDCDRHRLGART